MKRALIGFFLFGIVALAYLLSANPNPSPTSYTVIGVGLGWISAILFVLFLSHGEEVAGCREECVENLQKYLEKH